MPTCPLEFKRRWKPWRRQILILTFIALTSFALAQNTFPATGAAGIGTEFPNASSLLDITSTTKGVLIPRMTKKERDDKVTLATGLLIYQTNNTPVFYYFDGCSWKQITTGTAGSNKNLSNLTAPDVLEH